MIVEIKVRIPVPSQVNTLLFLFGRAMMTNEKLKQEIFFFFFYLRI